MSSGCGDVLSLADLQTAKKHQIFEAEVITGKSGGVAGGADIDYATNQVTGQTQKTLPAVLRDLGFEPAGFDFSTGGTLQTADRNVAVLWPISSGGDGSYYSWEGELPKTIPAGSTPSSSGGVASGAWRPVNDAVLRGQLASANGASLVGDLVSGDVQTALANRPLVFDSVSDLQTANLSQVADGYYVRTLRNAFGIMCDSLWTINDTPNSSTYSVVVGARYANLVIFPEMSFAAFGFGGTDIQNAAAVAEGNRVARANASVHTLRFPAGKFNIAYFTLDVDRRGFTWDGAGWDATYLVSTSDNISMLHVLLDPRDRAKDREHFYQTVKGFTIDGDITNKGATAAQRTVCAAHYSRIEYKSVGHRVSNVDLCGLVIKWRGLTGGRTNGATKTLYSVRTRYNSQKIDGYIGGADDNAVSLLVHGPSTTLTSEANVGDTTITVASSAGLYLHDIIEIAGGTLDAKIITGISGNTLTLDSGLLFAHSNAGTVKVPVYGTSVTGTIEVGQIQVGNSSGTEIRGMYAEQSKIYVFGYPDGLEIHGNTLGQAAPIIQIDSVNRNSVIRIVCNQTAFPINLNVADRNNSTNGILDLYMFPEIEISQSTRAQNSILINGIYAFKSINVERFYDSALNDRTMTSFKFTGFSAASAIATNTEILRFAQNVATTGYDGHSYDITAVIRRATGLSGIIKRVGQTSNIGGVISDTTVAASRTLSNYAFFDAANGMDVLVGSNTGRMGIVLKGEPSGGQAIKAMISGEIVSVI